MFKKYVRVENVYENRKLNRSDFMERKSRVTTVFVVSAIITGLFTIWGLFPLYFHLLEGISPVEVVANRVVWSLVFLVVLLVRRTRRPATAG